MRLPVLVTSILISSAQCQISECGLVDGFISFNASTFAVHLVKDSQTAYSLKPVNGSFDFVPADMMTGFSLTLPVGSLLNVTRGWDGVLELLSNVTNIETQPVEIGDSASGTDTLDDDTILTQAASMLSVSNVVTPTLHDLGCVKAASPPFASTVASLPPIMKCLTLLSTLLLLVNASAGIHINRDAPGPTVTLDNGTFVGTTDPSTGTSAFLGIPFAQPPIGDLRFRLPVPNNAYSGNYNATTFGATCLQQAVSTPQAVLTEEILGVVFGVGESAPSVPESEDCLTIDVWQPANVPVGAKLPVLVWIFGGGFQAGAVTQYPGQYVVQDSVRMGTPVLYVSMNYRLSALGFLSGQEVKQAGVSNIGLQDRQHILSP
ncbi:hypothetical protein NM688_g6365 [Phlebia brevispora]|uniref:Uncharacterized protein n=1 Tax=Phlebia brevispora TaxID=194682 RepID=A0ACC1SGR9_9APHY|nr:hypothetical protein NM688_g6365 [Phlebia brevispora]